MALLKDKYTIANPTRGAITVAGVEIPAGATKIVSVNVAHAKEEAETGQQESLLQAISKGCVVGTGQVKNQSGEYTGKLKNLTELVESGASQLRKAVRVVVSAGADAWAAKGL